MATSWTVRDLRQLLASGELRPSELAVQALARSNQNLSHNTYLWQNPAWTHAEAQHAESMLSGADGPFGDGRAPLWGLPVSLKDCFDLAGAPTSFGTRFYRDLNGIAPHDSWLAGQLRSAGAVIIGKTHVHPLTYGITGENPEFGDCLQPGNPTALTGGSSSGAVASVLEGSAVAAIGTDTGGSVRAPASLSGLAGYRATLGRGDWRGGAHLAPSFDTMGWLFRDLEDAPILAGIYAPSATSPRPPFTRFAYIVDSFLHDCEPAIVANLHAVVRELESLGLESRVIDPAWWAESREIFAPIQAWEAARIHAGKFHHFEPAIRERLEGGARITSGEVEAFRKRRAEFNARMDELFDAHQLVLLPSAPAAKLTAGLDHTQIRPRFLRYSTPFSLAGVPTIAIPCTAGGMQLAAARDCDEPLVDLAAKLGAHRKSAASKAHIS